MAEPTPTKRSIVNELHKPARRKYPRRKVEVRGIFDLWQADLVEMIPYATVNRGHKYLLTVIDVCSKVAWAVPSKNKTGENITAAMKKVLSSAGQAPKNLQVDEGSEFFNKKFEALMEEKGVNMYNTHSHVKASVVERFNRTLKTAMWKEFSLRGSYKWIDLLDRLLHEYNHRVHRSIGMKPADVRAHHEQELVRRLEHNTLRPRKPKFKVGDYVRVSKHKRLFEKGYTPNWGVEIFKIYKVRSTLPVTYMIEDLKGVPLEGCFYTEELQKTKHVKDYLVEKVLRRRKNGTESYVKWLGFDSTHNQWIKTSDII